MKSKPVKTTSAKLKRAKTSKSEDEGAVEVKRSVQRKQSKQLRFQTKLQDGKRTLAASKTIGKKKRKRSREKVAKILSSLSALADSLPSAEEVIASAETSKKKLARKKSHQQVVVTETKQLAAVLAHTEFQQNPYLAIQKHLANTLPSGDIPTMKQKPENNRQKKKKKSMSAKKKSRTALQPMDE